MYTAVAEVGAQNAQLADLLVVFVMIGMLKVLEHMQLGEQLSGEQQPSQYDEIPALQQG
jgi:hypothetical protein